MIHEATFPSLQATSLVLTPPCSHLLLFGQKMAAVLLITEVLLNDPISRLAFKVGSAGLRVQHWHDPSPDHALGASNVV